MPTNALLLIIIASIVGVIFGFVGWVGAHIINRPDTQTSKPLSFKRWLIVIIIALFGFILTEALGLSVEIIYKAITN